MKNNGWMVFILVIAFLCKPLALEAAKRYFETEAGVSHEELDSGYANWSSKYLEALVSLEDRKTFYGGLRETNRFSLYDSEVKAGMYYPVHEKVTAHLEGTESPTYRVLPKWSLLGQAELALSDGWGSALGLRTTEYTSSKVYQGTISVNKYWNSYMASYTFYETRVEDAGSGESHRVQIYYFYDENSRATIGYSTGKEVEKIGDGEVLVSDVRAITLNGRHWFGHNWAISWEISEHKQGAQYTRRGGLIGLRYAY